MTNRLRTLWLSAPLVVIGLIGPQAPALAQTDRIDPSPLLPQTDTPGSIGSRTLPSDAVINNAFSQVFKDSLGDFKRLPSRDTAIWLSIGAAAAAVGHTGDAEVTRTLSGSSSMHETLEPGAIIGGTPVQLGGAFAAYALGRLTNSPRVTGLGGDLIRAQILSETMTYAIKYSGGRTRPDGTGYSFPSGHTADSFATATVLQQHYGWKVGVPAYAVASYVAASRVQMKRHYLSDVAFGAAVGIIAGRTVTVGRGDARFAVAPMAAPGGGGIALNWLGKR